MSCGRISITSNWAVLALLAVSLAVCGCKNTVRALPDSPSLSAQMGVPASDLAWATAVDEEGLPNLHKVSDVLYRGAQPTDVGLLRLPSLGVKTVVNVRTDDTDGAGMSKLPITYEHLPMSAFNFGDDDVVRFLKLVSDEARTPVFLHCRHGADRTGVLCAMYRVVVQGWSREDAILEMTRGGMHFNSLFQNLVTYVRTADIEELRRRAGLDSPLATASVQ